MCVLFTTKPCSTNTHWMHCIVWFVFDMQISLILKIQSLSLLWSIPLIEAKCHAVGKIIVSYYAPLCKAKYSGIRVLASGLMWLPGKLLICFPFDSIPERTLIHDKNKLFVLLFMGGITCNLNRGNERENTSWSSVLVLCNTFNL